MLIQRHDALWLDELAQRVAALCTMHEGHAVYALLDGAFNDDCYRLLTRRGAALAWRSLFDLSPEPDKELAAASPILLALPAHSALAWRAVLACTDGWPMFSLIATAETLDALARRLSPWSVVNADGQYFVLRYADTRRLPDVVGVLQPAQHGALFGPAAAWMYRDRSAQWQSLPLPACSAPPLTYVRLDGAQCAALIGASESDEMLAGLMQNDPALVASLAPDAAYAAIVQSLAKADQYRITGYDRQSWCRLRLRYPTLEDDPQCAALLGALHDGSAAYRDVSGRLEALVQLSSLPHEGALQR